MAGETCHQDGLPGSCLARVEYSNAAVQVKQHAVEIAWRDRLGRNDERLNPSDRRRFHSDA